MTLDVNSQKTDNKNNAPNVVVIFSAKNEEKTIETCIETAKKSKYNPKIVVSDGFSTDNTRELAEKSGAKVVLGEKRVYPGKGVGMRSGLKAAMEMEPDIIVFLDSDILNLTPDWVDKLVEPVNEGHYDMTRGTYIRDPRDAGVTKLVAKPLLHVFFPEIAHYDQPLSGEIAACVQVWKELLEDNPPDGWGVDVWFLIETAMRGYKIREVFLGTKEHTSFEAYAHDLSKLAKMGEQVALAIIREAIKFSRIENAKIHNP